MRWRHFAQLLEFATKWKIVNSETGIFKLSQMVTVKEEGIQGCSVP